MKIILKPLFGIEIDDMTIRLGAPRADVERVLGPGEVIRGSSYYFGSEMRIDYDAGGCVAFIEFLGGYDGSLQPVIYGVEAFRIKADALYGILETHNNGPIDDREGGYSYAFCGISVGVYRESTPDALEGLIEEMKAEGVDVAHNEDVASERMRADHWATIGLGKKGYYL